MLAPGTKLIGRYEIAGSVGAGGMGEVYHARDLRLGRDVAIKVLPDHLSNDAQALSRFEREAKALAALSHNNILTIHDFGTDQGVSFAVMELLKGDTLRQLLSQSKLTWNRATEIGIAVAEGLAAAHSAGVIHRDLKPENVFLTSDGRIRILDFGLARWVEPTDTDQDTQAPTVTETATGAIAGTMPYMSPEQLRGERLDGRSDIFSFGSMLYEMVSGTRAFHGKTQVDLVSSILNTNPPELATVAPVPAAFQESVARCLKKNVEDRFQTAQDLVFALKLISSQPSTPKPDSPVSLERVRFRRVYWIPAAVVAFAIIAFLGYRFAPSTPAIHSLAILPFTNVNQDPNIEYLSDGITESIINSLSAVPQLKVMARGTVFSYKQKQLDPRKIGQELGVAAVVTGRVLREGETVVIRAELVEVSGGAQLWGDQYSEKHSNVLAIQEEISRKISEKLQLKLTGKEKQALARHPTENNEAYQLYLQGLYHWHQATHEGYEKSIQCYRRAIEKDPNYALAYAAISRAYGAIGIDGFSPASQACPQARSAVQRAMELDPQLPEAHIALALVYVTCDWKVDSGLRQWQSGMELSPNNADFRRYYSQFLAAAGRIDEAIVEGRKAQQLDPLSWDTSKGLGTVYLWAGKYDQAIEQYRKSLDLDPNPAQVHFLLGDAYARKAMYKEAIEEQKTGLTLLDSAEAALMLEEDFAALGYQQAMHNFYENFLAYLQDASQDNYVSPYAFASIYALLGDKDHAFESLEKAYAERSQQLFYIKVTPELDSLRTDPRYIDLVRRIGLS